MIEASAVVTVEDATGKLFLRESVAEGTLGDRPCEITKPVGAAASYLFELPEHKGKPRVQWLVKIDAEAVFAAMVAK